jgi:hypothetical protein
MAVNISLGDLFDETGMEMINLWDVINYDTNDNYRKVRYLLLLRHIDINKS